MNLALLPQKLPDVLQWIDRELARHAPEARPVASLGFTRLADYYPRELIASASFIPVAKTPVPPLSGWGLHGFEDFESLEAAGITFRSSYFVRESYLRHEPLHFHELVHVVQWRHLGPERFVLAYALGHIVGGSYRQNPLETMAYDLEDRFKAGAAPFDVDAIVRRDLDNMLPALFARAGAGA